MQTPPPQSDAAKALPRGEGGEFSPLPIGPRKRGAQPGNRNRWRHGGTSAATAAHRAKRAAELAPLFAACEAVIALAALERDFRDGSLPAPCRR